MIGLQFSHPSVNFQIQLHAVLTNHFLLPPMITFPLRSVHKKIPTITLPSDISTLINFQNVNICWQWRREITLILLLIQLFSSLTPGLVSPSTFIVNFLLSDCPSSIQDISAVVFTFQQLRSQLLKSLPRLLSNRVILFCLQCKLY